MSYTLSYILNGKKRTQSVSDFEASELKRQIFDSKENLIQIGDDIVSKKTVQLEKDDPTKIKKGDLRSDLNQAANQCKVCNRVGFVLKSDGCMHPCSCQIKIKEAHGKTGYDYSLYGDENVKTNVRLLDAEKRSQESLTDDQIRAGWIRAIKQSIKTAKNFDVKKYYSRIIDTYSLAPQEVGLNQEYWS